MYKKKNRRTGLFLLLGVLGLAGAGILLYPAYESRIVWRWEVFSTYVRGIFIPANAAPTPIPVTRQPTLTATTPATGQPTLTSTPPPTATATPEPLPESVRMPSPAYELQNINNCGPATLSMALKMYGWGGDQYSISDVIKPVPQDRNVNPDEMSYYVNNFAGWLRIETRVNGNLELLKRLLAAGFPVIIETAYLSEGEYWPNDDRWTAHYLLLTGYDEASQTFMTQDSYFGPDIPVKYDEIYKEWEPFNRVYMVPYLPDDASRLSDLLGPDWDVRANRERALADSKQAAEAEPDNPFLWFNLGNNYLYFEDYPQAAAAFDTARTLGLPQRMYRYQFGAFIAYFHTFRTEELLSLTEYALQRTPNSEEALLWQGWGLYRQGNTPRAIESWRRALAARPGYPDALYALDFVGSSP